MRPRVTADPAHQIEKPASTGKDSPAYPNSRPVKASQHSDNCGRVMSIPKNEIVGGGAGDEYPLLEGHRAKLLHRVTRRREFSLPDRSYTDAPEQMQRIVEGPHSPREKTAAARVLVSMQQSNNQLHTGEARINQILDPVKVERTPEQPEGFDETQETVFYEVVDPESKAETLRLMDEMGLLGRYLEQSGVKPTNGHPPTNGHANGNGHSNGNGKH